MITMNRYHYFANCLESYLEHKLPDSTLTVIDSGSTDKVTLPYLHYMTKSGCIDQLITGSNLSIAQAFRLALSKSPNAKYYVLIPDDCLFKSNDWYNKSVKLIEAKKNIVQVGIRQEYAKMEVNLQPEQTHEKVTYRHVPALGGTSVIRGDLRKSILEWSDKLTFSMSKRFIRMGHQIAHLTDELGSKSVVWDQSIEDGSNLGYPGYVKWRELHLDKIS